MVPALALGASLAIGASALPNPLYAAGFLNPTFTSTYGGAGTCIQGTIPISASAMNVQLNFPLPAVSPLSTSPFKPQQTHTTPEPISSNRNPRRIPPNRQHSSLPSNRFQTPRIRPLQYSRKTLLPHFLQLSERLLHPIPHPRRRVR
jgi:hypothetical protein